MRGFESKKGMMERDPILGMAMRGPALGDGALVYVPKSGTQQKAAGQACCPTADFVQSVEAGPTRGASATKSGGVIHAKGEMDNWS